jgi:hypothetical protein
MPCDSIFPVEPSGPEQTEGHWHELNPEKARKENRADHSAQRRNKLILYGLLVQHLAVVLENCRIEGDGN